MVLQQQTQVPIWGKSTPHKTIKVVTSWDKKSYESLSDASGKWMVKVATPKAGGPYKIEISGDGTVVLQDVLIGEVWICSGQSNMEMPLAGWGQIDNYQKEIADADYPDIRLFHVERTSSVVPTDHINVTGNGWRKCSPGNIPDFSATSYFFGRKLHQDLKIPIGLIHTSWGGTPAESWTSNESLEMMPEFRKEIEEIKSIPQDLQERNKLKEKKLKEYDMEVMSKDFGYKESIAVAASAGYDDSLWEQMVLPGHWEQKGLEGFDGFVWFRKTVDIPAAWENKELTLSLGAIDDNEVTFFNGTEIGRTDGFNVNRRYSIPARLVKRGKAVITVRVTDGGGEGGICGNSDDLFLSPAKNGLSKIDLSGNWKYKIALGKYDVTPVPAYYNEGNPYCLSSLYNAMIHPIVPYGIKGAIWYQGEANDTRAYQYRTLFPLMINDWRTKWGYSFPFYFVQLANYKQIEDMPEESDWAELREAQSGALHLANTGMAVTIDIGNANDIHPKNKQEVGRRLALIANSNLYGKDEPFSGPIFNSYKIDGNKVRISFTHTDGGLKAKGDEDLKGFCIAGPDRRFYRAEAIIEGDEVVVSSPDVIFPVAVRYAWANNPVCNLYNGAGLPASPFRTDDWPGKTSPYKQQ
ncbi:sialate O-acetylesterase [Dysgonomonas reticulitermitis]